MSTENDPYGFGDANTPFDEGYKPSKYPPLTLRDWLKNRDSAWVSCMLYDVALWLVKPLMAFALLSYVFGHEALKVLVVSTVTGFVADRIRHVVKIALLERNTAERLAVDLGWLDLGDIFLHGLGWTLDQAWETMGPNMRLYMPLGSMRRLAWLFGLRPDSMMADLLSLHYGRFQDDVIERDRKSRVYARKLGILADDEIQPEHENVQ